MLSENRIAHCDIKPENILIDWKESTSSSNEMNVRLIDFGSCVHGSERGSINMVTVEYMPPEVIKLLISEGKA